MQLLSLDAPDRQIRRLFHNDCVSLLINTSQSRLVCCILIPIQGSVKTKALTR